MCCCDNGIMVHKLLVNSNNNYANLCQTFNRLSMKSLSLFVKCFDALIEKYYFH